MSPPFSAKSVTLRQLFGDGYRLRIPDYQRAYAWTVTQAGQLIDDVLVALQDARVGDGSGDDDYFLGAVVLMETFDGPLSEVGSSALQVTRRQEIVDGLQRLLTLTMLFAVLRDLLADEAPESAALVADCVAGGGRAGDDTRDGERARFRLELTGEERAFLRDFVQAPNGTAAMPDDDDLTEAANRILVVREHLMALLVGEAPERLQALVAFLLDHCHCAVISARSLDRAHRIFSVLNDRGRPLARGDILKAQILGAAHASRRAEIGEMWSGLERRHGGSLDEILITSERSRDARVERIIDDIRDLIGRSGSAEAFVETMLMPYGRIIEAIREPRLLAFADDGAIAARIRYLGWLGSADWVPPLMLKWRLADGNPHALGPFLAQLDRLAYGMRLLGIGGDKRIRRYGALIEAIRGDTLDHPSSPLEITRDEQRLIAFNLRNLHARSQLACKLVLLRLNDEIAGFPQNLDPADYTVEHVLPQKPARTSQWRQWFALAEQREQSTQSLGNLILVSRDRNERARNLDLDRKLEIYFGDGVKQPHITRDIEGLAAWRPEDVQRREERLLGLIARLWQIGSLRNGSQANTGKADADDEAA